MILTKLMFDTYSDTTQDWFHGNRSWQLFRLASYIDLCSQKNLTTIHSGAGCTFCIMVAEAPPGEYKISTCVQATLYLNWV